MPVTTGHQKVQTNTMKGYRRPRQYIHHHCQLGHVSPGLSLLVSVCLLMLPMLGLVDEHVQLTTMYHMNPIHQGYVHPRHMTFSPTPLVLMLPSLDNVLPAMALQNRGVRLIIGCPSCTSSQSGVCHVPPILHLILPSGLGRRVVGVVLTLLLLLSGDIETNPGPVLSVDDLRVVMKELNAVRAKWNNIGVQLGVSVGTLDAIREKYSDPSDCLRETLTAWLKSSIPNEWMNVVDALNVVGEAKLAAELEHKYCSSKPVSSMSVPAQRITTTQPLAIATTPSPQYSVLPPSPTPDCPIPSHEVPATTQPASVTTLPHHPPQVTQYSVLPPATLSPISDHPTPLPEMRATTQPASVATPPHHTIPQSPTGISLW